MSVLSIYLENLHSWRYKCGKSVLDNASVENALKSNGELAPTWESEAGGSGFQG